MMKIHSFRPILHSKSYREPLQPFSLPLMIEETSGTPEMAQGTHPRSASTVSLPTGLASGDSIQVLPWKAITARNLAKRQDPESLSFWSEFSEAFWSFPEELRDRLQTRLLDWESGFRGAAWELFCWSQLFETVLELRIESVIEGSSKSSDFEWNGIDGVISLEATTYRLSNTMLRTLDIENRIFNQIEENISGGDLLIALRTKSANEVDFDLRMHIAELQGLIDANLGLGIQSEESFDWILEGTGWSFEVELRRPEGLEALETGSYAMLTPHRIEFDEVEAIRGALAFKLVKYENGASNAIVLALAEGAMHLSSRNFAHLSALYGQPTVQLDFATNESTRTMTFDGFFTTDVVKTQFISAVLFGEGTVPGFSSLVTPSLWLNPNAQIPLQVVDFPIKCDAIRLVNGKLEIRRSESEEDIWTALNIW